MNVLAFKKVERYIIVFISLIILCLISATINLCIGNSYIPLKNILHVLFFNTGTLQELNIILKIRLPRMLMVLLLGGSLSLSGFLLQTYFQNPIAGPFVLGISSGAKMTIAITLIFVARFFSSGINSLCFVFASFAGSLLSTCFILLVSKKVNNGASLLVAGIMIGYITSAVTDFIVTFAEDYDIVNLHNWSKGSFSNSNMESFYLCLLIVLISFFATIVLAKPIGAYRLGEVYAESMGVKVKFVRVMLILLSSLLSSCVTAFAGPISFVGIAVPFLVKQCMQSADPLLLIPGCFLGGAFFCSVCDFISRVLFSPLEMNISTITSFFGAPIVIILLLKKHTGKK